MNNNGYEKNLKPTKLELEFLTLAYNAFYDIFEEVFTDTFWHNSPYYRFSKIKDAFAIYSELLNYEPIKHAINDIKIKRPAMEGNIGSELFKFVRNLLSHYPFFNCWDEVWINKSISNWYKDGQAIDRFLNKYAGKSEVKYRFWEADKKEMTYLTISFPTKYNSDTKIYLKDMLTENKGVKFSLILMKKILDTQVIRK